MSHVVPSLTFQALLKNVVSRLGLGRESSSVTGLSPAAIALVTASTASTAPVFVVVPTDAEVDTLTGDARFFYSSLHGVSDVEVARKVLPFPSPEVDPYRAIAPHLDVASARARALSALAKGTARLVIASAPALLPRVARPTRLLEAYRELVVGSELSPSGLGDLLADAGFTPEDPVDAHGEFCVRGGVVDFFAAGESYPTRVEFIGDLIESLRHFDTGTQRSIATLDRSLVVPLRESFEHPDQLDDPGLRELNADIFDYLLNLPEVQTVVCNWDDCEQRVETVVDQIKASHLLAVNDGHRVPDPEILHLDWGKISKRLDNGCRFDVLGLDREEGGGELISSAVSCQPVIAFHGRLVDWVEAVRKGRAEGETQVFVAATQGRAERITELLSEYETSAVSTKQGKPTNRAALLIVTGILSQGFRLPTAGFQIFAETDLFDEERKIRDRRKSKAASFLSDLRDLKVGDHVVHMDHGIAQFVGLRQLAVQDRPHELMELRYAEGDKLFVPVEHLDLIQKYTGSQNPTLDRLGGASWDRAKSRVKKAMRDMADELLKLYASRQSISGHAFSADTHWQEEFEAAFEFDLTTDQASAVSEIKHDMEMALPMDRLLCGDVGYGKTEVALRAVFKAVMDGKQVALLAPTTVLAFQHTKTLKERFSAFPVRVEMISRFRSRAEQKVVLADLAAGKVEVIVGTHRLLSKDVKFHDLGLLVVDEEQRFGVAHKERLKTLRRKVDVLTLTATPIPRTLNMSLMGIRDMSIIETPPKDRLSIQTNVVRFDTSVVQRAIRTELERGGQVYFVHNWIGSIYGVADMIQRLVPEARLAVAHGQSSEADLEKVMVEFVNHRHDILLSTTIIENGLDIPNVNTIIVNHAERFGLAQLYQLRGRVGRSDRRAYAYLLVPADDLSEVAQKRLSAIKEFSNLGSGFRVAALDLEIRGAGNLLGGEQSGQIEAIGFDMYVKLLERTVRELKGESVGDERRATVNLGIELRIDEDYVGETNQRLALYRRVASAGDESDLSGLVEEIGDRYGPVPATLARLIEFGRIRVMADRLGIESIDRERHLLVIRFRPDAELDPQRLVEVVQRHPEVTLIPPGVVRVDLELPRGQDSRQPRRRLDTQVTSWWTDPAATGDVSGGFSKKEMSRSQPITADDQLLERVGEFLVELRGSA